MSRKILLRSLIIATAIIYGMLFSVNAGTELLVVVDPSDNVLASDDNSGTPNDPVRTIDRAFEIMYSNTADGLTGRIVLHEGIYRESIHWSDPPDIDFPLIIEAYEDDEVILSGSDVWDNWEQMGLYPVYAAEWPHDWGLVTDSLEWEEEELEYFYEWFYDSPEVYQRRELVFVNGTRLYQVVNRNEMFEGTYLVEEESDSIFIYPSANVNMEDAFIEVSMRESAMTLFTSSNIIVRNLIFQHTNPFMPGSAVDITSCDNITFENCTFRENNWHGATISNSSNITYRNCSAEDNGAAGYSGINGIDISLIDCEATRNNWRGIMVNMMRWYPAGLKYLHIHGLYVEGFHSYNNYTRGFWLDWDCEDVLLIDCDISDNWFDGVFFEACQGPLVIDNCRLEDNWRNGLELRCAENVTMRNSYIKGNDYAQVYLTGTDEYFVNFETGDSVTTRTINSVFTNNVFYATAEHQELFLSNSMYYYNFMATLTYENNVWYPYGGEGAAMNKPAGLSSDELIPAEFDLENAYPNPFNSSTTIRISLPEDSDLEVTVYNMLGKRVDVLTNRNYLAGYHSLEFNPDNLASGIYFIQANVPGKWNSMKKVVFLK